MAVFKRCEHAGTKAESTCDHEYWIKRMYAGRLAYGVWSKFQELIPEGHPLPLTSKREVEWLEGLVLDWLKRGAPEPMRPTPTPAPSTPATTSTPAPVAAAPVVDPNNPTPKTIADAVAIYKRGYTDPNVTDKGLPSIFKRITHDLGARPLLDLYDNAVMREYLDGVETKTIDGFKRKRPATTARDQMLKRARHMCGWIRGEYAKHSPALAAASLPFFDKFFNKSAVRLKDESNERERPKPDALAAILKAAAAYDDGGIMLGRIYCAIDTGIRQGQMLATTGNDIVGTGAELSIVIRRKARSKARRTYSIPVTSPELRKFLEKRRALDFPFGQLDGTRVDSFRTDWEKILTAAGLLGYRYGDRVKSRNGNKYSERVKTIDRDVHWHDLRHEFGSLLSDGNVPQRQIQKNMGHSRGTTTERYTNPEADQMRRNIAAAIQRRRRVLRLVKKAG